MERLTIGGLLVRPYLPEEDNARLLGFFGELSGRPGYVPGFNFGEVSWVGSRELSPTFESGVALVTDAADEIRGAVWLEPEAEFALTLAPELAADADVLAGLVRYGMGEAAGFLPGATDPVISCCLRGDDVLAGVFRAAGMVSEQTVVYHSYCRDLSGPVDVAPLPGGFAFRTIDHDQQVAERAAAHLSVWPGASVDEKNYRQVRAALWYRPTMDVVIEASDGQYAAFCLGWFDGEHQLGQFEPIGVRAEYRGKGLGKAVVLEGCLRMQESGAGKVYLNCNADNVAGTALYRSCGFELVGEWVRWTVPG